MPAPDFKTYIFGILLQFPKIWHQQKWWVFFFDLTGLQDPCVALSKSWHCQKQRSGPKPENDDDHERDSKYKSLLAVSCKRRRRVGWGPATWGTQCGCRWWEGWANLCWFSLLPFIFFMAYLQTRLWQAWQIIFKKKSKKIIVNLSLLPSRGRLFHIGYVERRLSMSPFLPLFQDALAFLKTMLDIN